MHTDLISDEARILVQAVAKAIFTDDQGTFEEQLERKNRHLGAVPLLKPEKAVRVENYEAVESTGRDLIFFNGLGGFTQDGRVEYALTGGRINTDAIDNSAGVDTSDHEVNIKILLDRVECDRQP